MLSDLKSKIESSVAEALKDAFSDQPSIPDIDFEVPADKAHGDLSCNIALKSAKLLKKNPVAIAEDFLKRINTTIADSNIKTAIKTVEVKNPGFINFFFSNEALCTVLEEVNRQKENYGSSNLGKKEKLQIEFVSANPTGPLSIAHARQAAVGDALANILNFIGFQVTKEYYVNDKGNQMNILGESIRLRGLQSFGEVLKFSDEYYQGDYISNMADEFVRMNNINSAVELEAVALDKIRDYGGTYLLDVIKEDLKDFGVEFDVFSHESKIAEDNQIEELIAFLEKKNLAFEKDGALWFETTKYGDDKDRVLRKSDGSYTYLTPDIVYHKNKFERGFNRVFNILGPDHHGYIPRLKAAAQALGKNADDLNVLIVQLATIYRDGKAVSMSTRKGEFISLREVIDEVGVDAARFFFLMRHIKVHLDFDLELAKKETSENPVYYIQYAHARIHSIHKKANEANLKPVHKNFKLLETKEELNLIKSLGFFPDVLEQCYNQLDPYALVSYLQDLATSFHKFYDCCKVVDEDADLGAERLGLCDATLRVLANGLTLIGVSTPESM